MACGMLLECCFWKKQNRQCSVGTWVAMEAQCKIEPLPASVQTAKYCCVIHLHNACIITFSAWAWSKNWRELKKNAGINRSRSPIYFYQKEKMNFEAFSFFYYCFSLCCWERDHKNSDLFVGKTVEFPAVWLDRTVFMVGVTACST